jgi:hypothetical protein
MSVDKDDAGNAFYSLAIKDGKTIDVYLDGVKQLKVITADEGEGYLKRYRLNNKGNPYPDVDGEACTVEEYGKVEIVIV